MAHPRHRPRNQRRDRYVDIGRETVAGWITRTAERIAGRAREDGNTFKDYSCTLLASVVGNEAAAFAQIGDGAIVARI
jgi:hypothetical protein